ncbi:hypothetical protein NMY22_g16409 [Coprinellus aureogranulatus]|nr:hypothetical protein NMY22_g16409 [Coprinellus aureogranulatus]
MSLSILANAQGPVNMGSVTHNVNGNYNNVNHGTISGGYYVGTSPVNNPHQTPERVDSGLMRTLSKNIQTTLLMADRTSVARKEQHASPNLSKRSASHQDAQGLYPTPETIPASLPELVSEEHIVPERPGPNPLQVPPPSPAPQVLQETPEASSSQTSQSIPLSGPTPVQQTPPVSASTQSTPQTQQRERMDAIAKVLKKKGGVAAHEWIAQVGFIHGREEKFKAGKTTLNFGRENQIIFITVFNPRRPRTSRLHKLVDSLSKEIGFFGLLIWDGYEGVLKPVAPSNPSNGVFQPDCGISKEGHLVRTGGDRPTICMQASNHAKREEGPLRLETDHEFTAENISDGSCLVKFRKLTFRGPDNYKLKNARVVILGDVPCTFSQIAPEQRSTSDAAGTVKKVDGRTRKIANTTGLEGEASTKTGFKVRAKYDRMTGEDVAATTETVCNMLKIGHTRDSSKSITVKYEPTGLFQASDRRDLILTCGGEGKVGDLPSVVIRPQEESLNSVTVRSLSKWVSDEEVSVTRSSWIGAVWSKLTRPFKKPLQPIVRRQQAELYFCAEVTVPYGTQGGFAAECDLETEF